MQADPDIDTLLLGCTHYPILLPKILRCVPDGVSVLSQGEIVARSLADYLRRHPEIDRKCTKGGRTEFLTTENSDIFNRLASMFLGDRICSTRITL